MASHLAASPPACPDCGTELAASFLTCPSCHRLVHAESLKRLASEAERATGAGEAVAAREAWRQALDLLPRGSRQATVVSEKIAQLSEQITVEPAAEAEAQKPSWAKKAGPLGAIGLVLWKVKFVLLAVLSKGKLLLLGLTKSTTLFTMLLSMGVYWTAWGWRFALGFVLSIYIHEMGHVAALQRYGIKATAPMFIPGFGAMVRLNQYPANPAEDARVGLAGPLWGLGAAALAYAVFLATAIPFWAAIARTGALVNLFNLIPVWQLDGSRGYSALSAGQRWVLTAGLAAAWFATGETLLILIGGVAAVRAFGGKGAAVPDNGALGQFLFLVVALAALAVVRVPGVTGP
jgi:Zn-dependent protease